MVSCILICVSVDSLRAKLNARELFKSLCIVTATSALIWEMRLRVVRRELGIWLLIDEVFCCWDPKLKQLQLFYSLQVYSQSIGV